MKIVIILMLREALGKRTVKRRNKRVRGIKKKRVKQRLKMRLLVQTVEDATYI
jgi:hypothetical protein